MTFPDLVQWLLYLSTRYVSPDAVAAEWVVAAIFAIALAGFLWRVPFATIAAKFRTMANRRRLAIALSFALPIVARLALLTIAPVPDPSIHDEFSHLLLADTLAHGRLANAPHPLWRHFESIHILQQPHYASMYPPAQGAFLALGQVVFGMPWAGVVLSAGLMCAALCWMLQGWLPAPWALFGVVLVILKICLTGLWIDSYLGGAASTIGAALVLGAVGRRAHPLLFATGLVILMNSRPFEGAFLAVAALVYLWFQKSLTRLFILPAAAVMAIGFAFTGYYNFRVTGKPALFPYVLNRDTYGWPENLGFLPPKKLAPLSDPTLEAMRQRELANRNIYRDPKLFFENLNTKLFESWVFFLGPVLTIPLLFAWRQGARVPLVFLAVLLGINLFQMVLYPYHLGPAVPLLFLLVTLGARALYGVLQRRNPAQAYAFAPALLLAVLSVSAMKEFSPELRLPLTYWEACREPHREARADAEDWLSRRPGQQLVLVRYAAKHSPSQEWVYNGADIDSAKVVWARERDDNTALLTYFANRAKWLLEADKYPQHVVPYAPPEP